MCMCVPSTDLSEGSACSCVCDFSSLDMQDGAFSKDDKSTVTHSSHFILQGYIILHYITNLSFFHIVCHMLSSMERL